MKTLPTFLRMSAVAVATSLLAGSLPVQALAADCYAVGQQVAAQNGGTLAKASSDGQGNCVIVVLVPAKDGQRPRRIEVVVPGG